MAKISGQAHIKTEIFHCFTDIANVESAYEGLKKIRVDNVKEYLEKKQQRLQEKKADSPQKSGQPTDKKRKVDEGNGSLQQEKTQTDLEDFF